MLIVLVIAILLAGCTPVRPVSDTPMPDKWQELRAWSPYPHTTPLPPQAATAIDGRYVRFDPRQQVRVPCRRCPPYPPEGGIWILEFDQGVFRVYHPRTRWRTLGSYTVEGSEVTVFNDPQCHLAVGTFAWQRNVAGLHFALVDDNCELGTRAKNFTAQPWQNCQPPAAEAATSGHWAAPEGCDPSALYVEATPKAPTLSQ
jgi:hypothetical protein